MQIVWGISFTRTFAPNQLSFIMRRFIPALFIACFFFASCVKKYHCVCTNTSTGESNMIDLSGIVYSKKQADKTCHGYESSGVSCKIE
ncbi:MAG: hypothetical protein JST26_17455 [Bacteroidetes bacterium]|nr:hypothetical protein [Bacteroidota bacterium]